MGIQISHNQLKGSRRYWAYVPIMVKDSLFPQGSCEMLQQVQCSSVCCCCSVNWAPVSRPHPYKLVSSMRRRRLLCCFCIDRVEKISTAKQRPELWRMPRTIARELCMPEDSLRQQRKSRRWQLHLVTQEGNMKHMQHHAWPAQHSERLPLVRYEVTHHASGGK